MRAACATQSASISIPRRRSFISPTTAAIGSRRIPHDELNRVTKAGQHFGYPYCHQGNVPDDQLGWGRACSEFEPPVALMGPHAGALGMRFYTGSMFPAAYRNAIFIARHGSWNKTAKIGGDIIVREAQPQWQREVLGAVLDRLLQDNTYIGRPVDVEVMKDGSLLVSDDYAGAIYRISYDGRRVAGTLIVLRHLARRESQPGRARGSDRRLGRKPIAPGGQNIGH
jgi:hypothetical protein